MDLYYKIICGSDDSEYYCCTDFEIYDVNDKTYRSYFISYEGKEYEDWDDISDIDLLVKNGDSVDIKKPDMTYKLVIITKEQYIEYRDWVRIK